LETILETSPSAVVIVNASSGKFSYANKRALKLYGFDTSGLDLDEHITKVKAKRMDGTDYPIDEMPVSQSLKLGQEVHDKEMILSRPDGQSFPVSVNAAPLRDTKGNITAAIVVFEDITQRKKAEKALRQAEERFRIALKNAPVSVAAQDLNHRYIWAYNQKTAKPDDIIGHTDREIFKPEEADYIDQIKERVLREGLELREQMWLERPSGRMYLDVTWSPLKDDTGKIVGITSATIDLTELKMAQEALKDRTERLEKTQKKLEENAVQLEEYANRMEELANERARKLQDSERMAAIGQVAGMVGHDIRNPLQSIVSELFLAKQSMKEVPKERTKEALESIDFIQEQIDYISKIVADLQDYSRPLKPEFRVVELCQFISDQIKKISIPDSVETSIFCEGQIPHIILDPTFMARILTNLVTNAIQAMPKGGKLAVTTSKQANNVLITVEDTGVGISDEVKSKMFTPLFTTKAKGQGFGLPVVKRLVEAQGGSISFESEVGKGTRFIVKLPLQK
jgi:PAS domain S-box-containing protein